jgi:hypothetical protein
MPPVGLDDVAERTHFKRLPTSFVLKPEEDRLRDAARRILASSADFQRLMKDLK